MTHSTTPSPPIVLSIAGSDSGGGAGIQADLKTISMLGCYGATAITAVTAQNTQSIRDIHYIPPHSVAQQLDAVFEDISADAVKTGMLATSGIIHAVAQALERHRASRLVVDPVMLSTSGRSLLDEEAREALVKALLPQALLICPNIPEAEVLSGMEIHSESSLKIAAERIKKLGPTYVLMKGGHLAQGAEAIDYLYDGQWRTFSAPRYKTQNTHGTGCTLAAAIAAYLARGESVPRAVERAKAYLSEAIRTALPLGSGPGPLNHGWPLA